MKLSTNQCYISCGLAAAFFGGMLYLTLNPYKNIVLDEFLQTLTEEQMVTFNLVHKERMQIYLMGLILGLLLGFTYLQMTKSCISRSCGFVAIVMGVNYLFYMIYPKSTYMVRHLREPEQLHKWQNLYRTMQYNQYLGMIIGLIAYVLVSII
jgi:hypothetical protein